MISTTMDSTPPTSPENWLQWLIVSFGALDIKLNLANDGYWPTAAGQALQADVGFLPEADIQPV